MATAGAATLLPGVSSAEGASAWVKLPTEAYRGKQDDVFFIDEAIGWYGNGAGKLYKTVDGGQTWTKQLDRPGTFVRALGFIDEKLGFFGNLGPDYFPNVSDDMPLYRTRDGGETWRPIEINGPAVKGICAIDVFKEPIVNAGHLDHKVTVRAAGRVGGPAHLVTSVDRGETWSSEDLSASTGMILDIRFVSDQVGFICGATSAKVAESRALILRTADGGRTWSPVYEGSRPWELTWKMSWPSERVGYVTIQSYNPDATVSQRYVAKSTDAGLTWNEAPLIDNPQVREFGIGFVDEQLGWVGAVPTGFETRDGGATWTPVAMGAAVNKIRIIPKQRGGYAVFAVGAELHRRDLPA
ncbi:hypothetical protein N0B44_21180 [Roseibacterium beibuensis]|uniref:WD40/YVTN/BNR-like repeat-containing protein n=1 Tax=[Roseibacterium] beibuensis TaxID=1193142 RepID=UPI00217D222B|nr:hypothetical protein [Roseibacterium beibuensis]MCS6625429.1 hypothetical protein [Roseibacterium beibuensis]